MLLDLRCLLINNPLVVSALFETSSVETRRQRIVVLVVVFPLLWDDLFITRQFL